MRYLNQNLVKSHIHYGLCLTEPEFKQELKNLGVYRRVGFLPHKDARAATHFFDDTHGCNMEPGAKVMIVCMPRIVGEGGILAASVLVHEAVHIFQAVRSFLGETMPSSEFEAYSIQHIAQELMQSYAREAKK